MNKNSKIRVTFINHTAIIGGAERSLLDILTFINREKFEPMFICFEEGELVEKVKEIGIQVMVISFPKKVLKFDRDKKHLSQILIPILLVLPIIRLWFFIQTSKSDVLYSNSMKAHFISVIVGKVSFKKVIWHVRDILDEGLNRRLFVIFSQIPDNIICISNAVANQFSNNKRVKVVYNGMLPIEEVPINERV
ncbi:glycosyltransferase [Metabacillus litoralis]|uniref:glycosyltransferase n=1 Tax=Metabacillus litoralis TaxID=152268 RepID=UPI00203FAADE|nr:glycosyltransferase [Metabacillus litoralis]MCM3161737.1 glycosyltransferase [Metabacillus litoralis]